MKIRQARQADRQAFYDMWLAFLQETSEDGRLLAPTRYNMSFFAHWYDQILLGFKGGFVLFAEDDEGERVGVGFYAEDPPDSMQLTVARPIRCWGIWVDPKHRGKGISLKLQQEGIEEARRLGYLNYLGAFSRTKSRTKELLDQGASIVESVILIPLGE